MDPLSATASAIAIAQAISAIAIGVQTLKSVRNAPAEFEALVADLTTLEAILKLTHDSLQALQTPGSAISAIAFSAVQTLHQELCQVAKALQDLTTSLTAESKGLNKKGQHRVGRIKWLREKDSITNLRDRAQRLHLELSTCFVAISASNGVQQTALVTEVKSIAETTAVAVSEGIGSLQNKLTRHGSLDLVCDLQQRDGSALQAIEPRFSDMVQNSNEGIELLRRNAALLDDLQSGLSRQITPRDLEPIIMAINCLSAQMARQAPRITSPRARASLPIVDDSNSLRRRRCSPLCKCSCHKFLRASSPSWLQPALGAMSLKYSLISYGRRKPCSSPLCDSRSDTSIDIQYQFPLWLAARAVFCSLSWRSLTGVGASLWLKVPRIVDIDLLTILESSDIETRLSTFQVLPTDIDSKFGLNLLTSAMGFGLLSCLPSLLRFGADPRMPDLYGRSGADWARVYLYYPDNTTVKMQYSQILQKIAHLDDDEPRSTSMIHDAVLGRITVPLEECITLQPDQINSLDDFGLAPLHLAVLTGNVDAIHTLVELGADIDCPSRTTNKSPLHLACQEVFDNIAKIFQESFVRVALALIDHGASVHVQDSRGTTPLHISYKHPTLTRRLLSLGADPNTRSKAGYTAFHMVISLPRESQKSQYQVLKAYSEAGADLNAYFGGWAVLHHAALFYPSLMPLLLKLGANATSLTDEGFSVIHLLTFGDNVLRLMNKFPMPLLQGLNPDLANNFGSRPIDLLGRVPVVRDGVISDEVYHRPLQDAVRFVRLIVELRELNWNAGLFLPYKERFEQDGSHDQMKGWVSLQTERLQKHEGDGDIVWDPLEMMPWHGLDLHNGNISDSEDESQTEEEADIEEGTGCETRERGGNCMAEVDTRQEESEDEDDEFFDAVQS